MFVICVCHLCTSLLTLGETPPTISADAISAFGKSVHMSAPSTVPTSEPSPPITIIAMNAIASESWKLSCVAAPRYQTYMAPEAQTMNDEIEKLSTRT